MHIEIVSLQEKHYEEAARLVAGRFRSLRKRLPLLPPRYEDPWVMLDMLSGQDSALPGAAALEGGRLVGFMRGLVLEQFQDLRTYYSPEWANAAQTAHSRLIYEDLYAWLAPRLLESGFRQHALSLMADDESALQGWVWMGFGMVSVDGLRPLEAISRETPNLLFRRAETGDIEKLTLMLDDLRRHIAGPPSYVRLDVGDPASLLQDPANQFWLAYQGGEAVGLMGLQSNYTKACAVLQDERTIQLEPAYIPPERRGQGIGPALLSRCLEIAKGEGYLRCAVDFESANLQAQRFWMRWFEPVCYSFVRSIDERVSKTLQRLR